MTILRSCLILLSGALFGTGLALSGMTNPERVLGFLDILGNWDPTLAAVMAGALLVFSVGLVFLRRRGSGWADVPLPDLSSGPVNRSLVSGSILFGAGWGLSGYCPGPAIANLGGLHPEAFVFVPAMILGAWLTQRVAGADT